MVPPPAPLLLCWLRPSSPRATVDVVDSVTAPWRTAFRRIPRHRRERPPLRLVSEFFWRGAFRHFAMRKDGRRVNIPPDRVFWARARDPRPGLVPRPPSATAAIRGNVPRPPSAGGARAQARRA
jgi:hypothetical protein